MFTKAVYTAFSIVCILIAVFAAVALFQFLRKLTVKESEKKEWYRYAVPSLLAVFFSMLFNDIGMGGAGQWIYFLLVAIGVPLALSFHFLRDTLENKNERLVVIVAFLLLLNAGVFTALWSFHYRATHAIDLNDAQDENGNAQQEEGNPHLTKRNWFLIPLWALTLVVSVVSRVMWTRINTQETTSEESEYLPF